MKRNFMVEFIKTEDYWVLMDLVCRQGALLGFNILPRHSSVFWLPLHYTDIGWEPQECDGDHTEPALSW